jgi:hypothetical protein
MTWELALQIPLYNTILGLAEPIKFQPSLVLDSFLDPSVDFLSTSS